MGYCNRQRPASAASLPDYDAIAVKQLRSTVLTLRGNPVRRKPAGG